MNLPVLWLPPSAQITMGDFLCLALAKKNNFSSISTDIFKDQSPHGKGNKEWKSHVVNVDASQKGEQQGGCKILKGEKQQSSLGITVDAKGERSGSSGSSERSDNSENSDDSRGGNARRCSNAPTGETNQRNPPSEEQMNILQNNLIRGVINKFWPFGEKKDEARRKEGTSNGSGHGGGGGEGGGDPPDPDKQPWWANQSRGNQPKERSSEGDPSEEAPSEEAPSEGAPSEGASPEERPPRETHRPSRGTDHDKETNFLLKALETGKFPSYCLVENIDENLDNCEIYMSKEKMEELNLSEGFTVLLKGKKKKEMLAVTKLDKKLKKHFVVISFAMKKNLRLMHNDIIKIYPLMKVSPLRTVVLSPFSDTVGGLTKRELEEEVLKPYLKGSLKPLCDNTTMYIPHKGKKIEFRVVKLLKERGDEEEGHRQDEERSTGGVDIPTSQQYGYVGDNAIITLDEEYLNREDYEEHTDDITYEDLGGMKKQLNKIRELIELPLKYPEIFISIGISAPKGVLMHGIPGTGKTSIAKAIANESNAYCYIINGPEIMSKHIGESEQKLRKIFKKASEKTPCIIFIDEIDSIANKRSKSTNELEKRVVSQLLTLMDGLKKNNNVLVLAATNRPNSIDPALRRFGRFDREIEIPVPDEQGRYEILLTKTKKMKLDADVNLRKIAKECHGYVGADLAQLCFEAAIQCIKEHVHFLDLDEEDFIEFMKISVDERRGTDGEGTVSGESSVSPGGEGVKGRSGFFFFQRGEPKLAAKSAKSAKSAASSKSANSEASTPLSKSGERADTKNAERLDSRAKKIPPYILSKLTIKAKHFQHALNICNPSSLRERQVQIPTVTWDDIGGMHEVKEQLKETILYPLEYKHLYAKFNSNYNKGILLYGPPGCGKTLLAKAIANECNANFISVKGPELLTMWFGESEANVRDLFDKARAASPCIIFFDEIDSLAKERNSSNNNDASDRVINQILTEIDGINEKKTIFIIAATNRPDILDKALTRPGRLDKLIYISLPDYKSRFSIFKAILKNTPLSKDVDLYDMAKRTEGFSGADITNLCQSAVNEAIKETIHLINQRKAEKGGAGTRGADDQYDPVPTLAKKHFDLAFKNARISIRPEDVLKYERFKEKLSLQNFD
ncbi:cell division cycle ATPase [Plasmodium cynomolgi strain B]|uniref:Cell division cycle ATPase n=1 Tax=Plasmodium cynomolgi (strain B) TaxID=1120755 RepID=K6UPE0_PLACD|nr:cell division cycle ATPase [Plasmodium cynomolgi strain B]GAB64449.1 cell division cycle ATPase [Plasmodium cynomolgi strain B]